MKIFGLHVGQNLDFRKFIIGLWNVEKGNWDEEMTRGLAMRRAAMSQGYTGCSCAAQPVMARARARA